MNLAELLENEWYMVRHSGEIPEIALNSSLYFLTRAKDGPHLKLTAEQLETLQQAAVERFREIILRDLDHDNVDTSVYRGIARSYANYQRFIAFCQRQQLDATVLRGEAAEALHNFLSRELAEVEALNRTTVLNCSHAEICEYAALLEVGLEDYPNLGIFCPLGD